MQSGVGLLRPDNGKLQPKSSGFQSELVTRNEEGAKVGDPREGKRKHRLILLECTFCQNAPKLDPLILRGDGILMTYTGWILRLGGQDELAQDFARGLWLG